MIATARKDHTGANLHFELCDINTIDFESQFDVVFSNATLHWIKDHKNALRSDLTSCHRFAANQFRVLLHSLAYMLLHQFRARALRRTELARSQMDTIRCRLLKIGAQVTQSARRIRFHLPTALATSSLLHTAYANIDTG